MTYQPIKRHSKFGSRTRTKTRKQPEDALLPPRDQPHSAYSELKGKSGLIFLSILSQEGRP